MWIARSLSAFAIVALVPIVIAGDAAPGRTFVEHRYQDSRDFQGLPESASLRMARLRQWIAAVHAHEPGVEDASVRTVGSWSTAELESVFPCVKALAELIGSGGIKSSAVVFSSTERKFLQGLAFREAQRPDINNLMKRGALLHTDVAILVPQAENPMPPSPEPRARDVRAVPQRIAVVSTDGRFQKLERDGLHWEFGRMLLMTVTPNPTGDPMVKLWYHAVATYLARELLMSEAPVHLARARQLFPDDADLNFDSGCMHETLASARVQTLVATTTLPGLDTKAFPYASRLKIDVASASSNLRDAERYFRRALERRPDFVEARVRLARVLFLQGQADAARTDLRRSLPDTDDSVLLYYAHLFLADAEQALGGLDAAREAYEGAAALYPRAQSPYLGLSLLARRQGNGDRALETIQTMWSLEADQAGRPDPWWTYDLGGGPQADGLLDQLRAPFRGSSP